MTYLYLLLDIAAIAGPLALSFDRKVSYYKKWKHVLLASLIICVPFLIWDIIFTSHGIWSFNSNYLTGFKFFNLPIEEVLFFIIVPFACTFIYECVKYYLKEFNLSLIDRFISLLLLAYIVTLLIVSSNGLYTIVVSICGIIVLILWHKFKVNDFIGISFILSLIPFFLMNGILTGSFIEEPIVEYNNAENVAIRIFTIPMEDIIYAMSLIVSVILTFEKLKTFKRG